MGAGDLAQANVSFPRSPFPANCDVAGGVGIDPDSERVADHPPAGPGKYYGVTREQWSDPAAYESVLERVLPLGGEVAFGYRRGHMTSGPALRAATQ